MFRDKNYWALILGGSGGIGLASAKKLASEGMNVYVVHRDRRSCLPYIERQFDAMRKHGVEVVTKNINALNSEGRQKVIADIREKVGERKVRLLLHSVAFGSLKPIVKNESRVENYALRQLASSLKLSEESVESVIEDLYERGNTEFASLSKRQQFEVDSEISEDELSKTIQNMGTNILFWARDLLREELFTTDSRVIGLTSEGNEIVWKGYAAVAAAKSALESIVRAIAVEMAPFGIRANILQPGVTDTLALQKIPGGRKMLAAAKNRNPCGRTTSPDDVAGMVALMCTDEAGWVNGSLIRVDGGEHISA